MSLGCLVGLLKEANKATQTRFRFDLKKLKDSSLVDTLGKTFESHLMLHHDGKNTNVNSITVNFNSAMIDIAKQNGKKKLLGTTNAHKINPFFLFQMHADELLLNPINSPS